MKIGRIKWPARLKPWQKINGQKGKRLLSVLLSLLVIQPLFSLDNDFTLSINVGCSWNFLVRSFLVYPPAPPAKPDAVTGATRIGLNTGVRLAKKVLGHAIETGLDFNFFQTGLNYNDTDRNIVGSRTLTLASVSLSAIFDFHLFNRSSGDPYLKICPGFFAAYYPYADVAQTVNPGNYNLNRFTIGPAIRVYVYPFDIVDNKYLGFYLEVQQSLNHFLVDKAYSDRNLWDAASKCLGLSYNF
jgi:hypothetical protein